MHFKQIQLHMYCLMLFCTITPAEEKITFKSCILWHFIANWMLPMTFGTIFLRCQTRQWSLSQKRFCYWVVGVWRTFSVHEALLSLVKVAICTSILETSLTNEIRNKLKRKKVYCNEKLLFFLYYLTPFT